MLGLSHSSAQRLAELQVLQVALGGEMPSHGPGQRGKFACHTTARRV